MNVATLFTLIAIVLHGVSLAEAQRPPTAPSGDVYSSSGNCQRAYQQAAAQINAQHSRDWPACHGESSCIRAANARKADALAEEGRKLRLCQATPGSSPGSTQGSRPGQTPGAEVPSREDQSIIDLAIPKTRPTPPGQGATPPGQPTTPPGQASAPPGQPAVAPGFRPGPANTWKPQDVTWKGEKWAVYTDAKRQPWRFKPEFLDYAQVKWVLDRNTVKADDIYAGRQTPTANYQQVDELGRTTGGQHRYPAFPVENFPYAP